MAETGKAIKEFNHRLSVVIWVKRHVQERTMLTTDRSLLVVDGSNTSGNSVNIEEDAAGGAVLSISAVSHS